MTDESDWQDHVPFDGPRAFHRSVSCGQHLYVIGGYWAKESVPEVYRDVQTCMLLADGSLGGWSETTPLPESRAGHGCVVHGNRIYIVGGWRDRSFLGDTLIGTIAPDGTIERWDEGAHLLNTPRSNLGLAVCSLPNGRSYVYAVGGAAYHPSETRHLANVEYAEIGEDGALGEWCTSPYTLAGCRAGVAAVVVDDRLYVIGGWGDWEIFGDAQYTQIGDDGATGYWYKGGFTLPLRTAGHDALAVGGQQGENAAHAWRSTCGGPLLGFYAACPSPTRAMATWFDRALDLRLSPARARSIRAYARLRPITPVRLGRNEPARPLPQHGAVRVLPARALRECRHSERLARAE